MNNIRTISADERERMLFKAGLATQNLQKKDHD